MIILRNRFIYFILFGLLFIGFFITLLTNPLSIFIPLVIIGVVFLLFHRQNPQALKKKQAMKQSQKKYAKLRYTHTGQPSKKKTGKKKSYPFQVIDGYKGKEKPPSDSSGEHQLH